MKRIISLLTGLFFISAFAFAQDCTFYFPSTEGTQLEMKHYNKSDKLESVSYQKLLKIKSTGKNMSADVEIRSVNAKGKEEFKKTITIQCKEGVFVMDMSNLVPDNMNMEEMEGMEVKVSGTDMTVPGDLRVGMTLPDATMKISIMSGGMNIMSVETVVKNRKVEAAEKVTTPAGTFDCFKISMDIESKSMMTVKMKVVEWLARDIGVVKTENYDQNNKKEGYSLLTAIQK